MREGWPEVADFNDNVMKVGLAGGTLAYRDFPLTLYRHGGSPEQVWLNLDYSPLLGEDGRPAGVMAIVVEITDKVRIERELEAEREEPQAHVRAGARLHRGVARTRSSFHHGRTRPIGRWSGIAMSSDGPCVEALPEVVEQGFVDCSIKSMVQASPYVGRGARSICSKLRTARSDEHYLDFVYQPIVADGGVTTGIFIQGHDVTEQHETEQAIRAESRKLDVSQPDRRCPGRRA